MPLSECDHIYTNTKRTDANGQTSGDGSVKRTNCVYISTCVHTAMACVRQTNFEGNKRIITGSTGNFPLAQPKSECSESWTIFSKMNAHFYFVLCLMATIILGNGECFRANASGTGLANKIDRDRHRQTVAQYGANA